MFNLQNSEQNPANFEIPSNEYTPRVESDSAPKPDINAGEIVENDKVLLALAEVQQVIELPKKLEYEQIEEEIFQEMINRGQQIDNARRYHLEQEPYKYPVRGNGVVKNSVNMIKNSFYEKKTKADLIEKEREIGARIFGIPGFSFFMTEAEHWWSHFIKSEGGSVSEVTTHYEVMLMAAKAQVLKCSSEIHQRNEFISGEELKNLNDATKMYHKLVMQELYDQQSNIVNIDDYVK